MTNIIVKLTIVEANHLLSLMNTNEENGEHYRPKEQYWKRHYRIKQKLLGVKVNE
jgi:hypothetical protein